MYSLLLIHPRLPAEHPGRHSVALPGAYNQYLSGAKGHAAVSYSNSRITLQAQQYLLS
ncbi:hypothetical protein [Acutalibacter sp. 1XD8-36]|uniref:hypothetical protein n=1 Tax=Acutalibacter sp. 1XD8-36 TaxID=2320852 RepID=UPI00260BA04D|nr:hypothetical protein [Acutalibacter sp. 1XD8-36]